MAIRKKTRASTAQIDFDAISIEGSLIAPEWLSKIAQLAAGSQSEPDYQIPKGLNLRDEIGRFYRMAQAHWQDFSKSINTSASGTASERFVRALLHDCFGFKALIACSPVSVAERSYPIGFSTLNSAVPVVICAASESIEQLQPRFGDAGRRRSAFGLVQEYLNAQEHALWGITSNGHHMRIVRDNASLTRPAWIEADLQRIFTEDRFADFTALWLLAHESRFGREGQAAHESILEQWRNAGREQGTRARDQLRRGVEEALVALGQGFIAHPDNHPLRQMLESGVLSNHGFFNQLLRLVYRLIFLLTTEDRGLLHAAAAEEAARKLYADGYCIKRLSEKSLRRSAHDRYSDHWQACKIVFRGLASGENVLGLPALAGIFSLDQCAALDSAKLENRALLLAVFKLAWLRSEGALARVNWRDMGPEELGSVYESLLELVPKVILHDRSFSFATGAETKGNARKTSGSYYTPDSLVQLLLDSALDPVIVDTLSRNLNHPVDALLALTIVDPACGSGHFLLAASRRLAAQVARAQANGTPSASEYRHALRQVVGRCIFGVDLNPMAVELCKVSLWMEAVEPGLPLSFLDSHIQHGNALFGTTPALMQNGIPDAAWDPIEGDDRKVASALKKKNKQETKDQTADANGFKGQINFDFSTKPTLSASDEVLRAAADLEASSDADLASLNQKSERWTQLLHSKTFMRERFVADAWCAAFVWPKHLGNEFELAPTHRQWLELSKLGNMPSMWLHTTVNDLSEQFRFFHWHLQFPQVFAKGGFDVVLGNPPWERVKLQEQEFFAPRNSAITNAANSAARKQLIAALPTSDPVLWQYWTKATRIAQGESHWIRHSGRYPLCGSGDINTYAIFAEHNLNSIGPGGRSGFIVPAGIIADDSTKQYLNFLVRERLLVSSFHFENEHKLFLHVHHAFRFVLLTIGHEERPLFVSFARNDLDVADSNRRVVLSATDLEKVNPNTKTCPTFRLKSDANLSLSIYRRVEVLWNEAGSDSATGNFWGLQFMTMFHMSGDSEIFSTRPQLESAGCILYGNVFLSDQIFLPLFEAKMMHQFDHRFGTYEGQSSAQENQGKLPEIDAIAHESPGLVTLPYYWVAKAKVSARLADRWPYNWFLGWRDITGTENQRTVVASLIPMTGVGHTNPILLSNCLPSRIACLYASLCSFVLDYSARQKIGGTHLTYSYLKQLPVLRPETYANVSPWQRNIDIVDWILLRVLELTYTAWDIEPFARDVGYVGAPFIWNAERRFLLRAELDAAFFLLYGLSRDDTEYVMDTFPVVRKNDVKDHGEYRTKRQILEIYDAMALAIESGTSYQTMLDPPPADPLHAHAVYQAQSVPNSFAEALRMGLLFLLLRLHQEPTPVSHLMRVLLWLEKPSGIDLIDDEMLRGKLKELIDADSLITENAAMARIDVLLNAFVTANLVVRRGDRIEVNSSTARPHWLPQTGPLLELANTVAQALNVQMRAVDTVEVAKRAEVKSA